MNLSKFLDKHDFYHTEILLSRMLEERKNPSGLVVSPRLLSDVLKELGL